MEKGDYYIGKGREIVKVLNVELIVGDLGTHRNGPDQVDFLVVKDVKNVWNGSNETWTYVPFFISYFTKTENAGLIYGD